jgi:hypothetical protein
VGLSKPPHDCKTMALIDICCIILINLQPAAYIANRKKSKFSNIGTKCYRNGECVDIHTDGDKIFNVKF